LVRGRTHMRTTPFHCIQQRCDPLIPSSFIKYLPRKWEKIGDILLLRLPEELTPFESTIGGIYASALSCKSVLREISGIDGVFRVPNMKHIWGEIDTETIHYENGIRFRLDPSKVMFSSGNMDERIRMSTIAAPYETIVDMFAGIGYFSIPLAYHSRPQKVFSCEINPIAYGFLTQNIVLNDVTDIVEPLFGDNALIAPHEVADRVIMGYFGQTSSYLPIALSCLKRKGGTIHYHDIFPERTIPFNVIRDITKIIDALDKKVIVQSYKKIKSYAPGIGHYVFNLKIEP